MYSQSAVIRLQNPVNATVNMTVFMSAYIDGVGGPQFCERQLGTGQQFSRWIYSVDAGGVPVYDSVVTQVVNTDTSNSAMNFSGRSYRSLPFDGSW